MEHFITSVHINEVRHLKDIEIKLNPEKRQHLIAEQKGFVLESHTMMLYGICPACQKKRP